MLSLFPSLLAFGFIGTFLLRIILGITIIHFAYTNIRVKKHASVVLGIIQSIAGLFLFFGIYTQLAAFITCIILGLLLAKKVMKKAFLTDGVNYYLILFIIALSLIFTGPGSFAFDLPL